MEKFFVACSLVVLLLGCSSTSSTNQTEISNNHEIIEKHGDISNGERLTMFVENVSNKNKDFIKVTRYSIEGSPIYYILDFNGQEINYTLDNSQDAFAGSDRGPHTTECRGIEVKDQSYVLTGCQSDIGYSFEFPEQ